VFRNYINNAVLKNITFLSVMVAVILTACLFPIANAIGDTPPLRFNEYKYKTNHVFVGQLLTEQEIQAHPNLPEGAFMHFKVTSEKPATLETISCTIPRFQRAQDIPSNVDLKISGTVKSHTPTGLVMQRRSCRFSFAAN
jgi:hypothetical protein